MEANKLASLEKLVKDFVKLSLDEQIYITGVACGMVVAKSSKSVREVREICKV